MKMSRVETAVRCILAWYEGFNRQDYAAMLAQAGAACRLCSFFPMPAGSTHIGAAALTRYWDAFHAAYPGAQLTIEDLYGPGLRGAARWRLDWGAGAGFLRGADLFLVKDGVIQEIHCYLQSWSVTE